MKDIKTIIYIVLSILTKYTIHILIVIILAKKIVMGKHKIVFKC